MGILGGKAIVANPAGGVVPLAGGASSYAS